MQRKLALLFTFFLFFTSAYSQKSEGYRIDVTISGLRDSVLYLAYHMGDRQYVADTLKLDGRGNGTFSGKKSLPGGIYMVVLPGRRYFEVLISDDQDFSLSCTAKDYFSTLRFTGSEENSAFMEYQHEWVRLQTRANSLNERAQKNKQNPDSLKYLTAALEKQEKVMKEYLMGVAASHKGTLLAILVKAILPVEVPEFRIPTNSPNPDSTKWVMSYFYSRVHFFDNIALDDERIVRTPILQARLKAYFSRPDIQQPDTMMTEVDRVLKKCQASYKVFQYVSVFLFNYFRESEIMGHDAVMVKLADDIYLSGKADWTTKEWRDNLKNEVDRIRPSLIGVKGHDLVMNTYKGVYASLYDIEKDFTILYFWEPNCGHCQEATPKLKAYYDKARNNGVEVFAVCTQNDKAKWEKYIKDNNLDWINGWDPQRMTNYDYYYNVTSTPGIYILDRDKKIIAKKLPVESIESFIDNYRKFGMKPAGHTR
ncbi:MAG: thioredoxin-like domain-containing protein [Bacteroidales bacterium]